ncbi:unnamed protein product [Protopolystoma xenopodis]|uniref:Uncharacterized protein n=1 Tax=Protopolystoma xenopodis TaxID=117903 RepID=A0A3S5CM96_9PLAT|nr:unnamed protein product [Protopolystoma xenopodis]
MRITSIIGGFICYLLCDGCTYSAGILYTVFLSAFSANSVSTSLLPGLIYAIPQIIALIVCPFIEVAGYSASAAYGAAILGFSFVGLIIFLFYMFPLASACTMLGSGFGIFISNPLLAWALSLWTWREIFFIEAALFLNVLISSAFFYWLDENKRLMSISAENSDYIKSQPKTITHLKNSIASNSDHGSQNSWTRILFSLRDSIFQLASRRIWTNRPYLFYLVINALVIGADVIPWTFMYDYIRREAELGLKYAGENAELNEELFAWLPSSMGIGSCIGMVFYGATAYAMDSLAKRRKLKRNHVFDIPSLAESTDIQLKASPAPSQKHPIYRHFYLSMLRRHWMLFSLNVFINCASMLFDQTATYFPTFILAASLSGLGCVLTFISWIVEFLIGHPSSKYEKAENLEEQFSSVSMKLISSLEVDEM